MNVSPQNNYEEYLLLFQIDCKIIEIFIKNQSIYNFHCIKHCLGRFVKFYEPFLIPKVL